jgi:hypothetical protein
VLLGDIDMSADYFDHVTVATQDRMTHGMHTFCRSIRETDSKINFEVCFLPDRLRYHFENSTPVFRKNPIMKRFYSQNIFIPFRLEPKKLLYFGRPIHEISPMHVPSPTTCVAQALGFGQIGLGAPQLAFRFPYNRHILHRPQKTRRHLMPLSQRALRRGGISQTIRHQQSIFMIEILPVAGRPLDRLLHGDEIFRMGALEKKLQAWFGRSVVLEDSERFI